MKFLFSGNPKTNFTRLAVLILMLMSSTLKAQLDNPDWGDNAISCVTDALLYPGVGVVTCGVVQDVPASGRYVVAYMGLNNGIPTSAPLRDDITDADSVLHHSDWLVSNIGNVFGTAINQSTAEVFVTSSSNYGAGFGFTNNSPAILNYGVVGSPANSTEAAGTVYRIDPVTGAVTVFVRLPQQTTTVAHWDCEDDAIEITRNNTGVGLGNIAYDELNDQYFVTNTEDGRIYRISSAGAILDSYDPLTYDTGAAGIDNLEEVPYGIAVEPGSNRLFFGFVDDPGAGPAGAQALPGAPSIYSIDLNSSGGFVGTVDNTTMPTGATYDNYVGTDQLHGTIPTSNPGGEFSYTDHTVYFISDLAFAPDGTLLAAVRVGCHGSWHSSYNHWAETDVIALNTVNNLYDTTPFEYDISFLGDAGDDDTYGGVATYELTNAGCDVHYATSSADVLTEVGPHGIAIWDSGTTSAPVSPLGVFEYGVLPNEDPKGIGGDIEIYNGCNNSCNITGDMTSCEGQNVTLTYTPDCSSSLFTWQITAGDATIVGANDQTMVTVTAGASNYTISLIPTGSAIICTYDVTVTALVNPSISGGPFCINDSPANLTGSPAGGTYSGTGITDGSAGTFDPATAGVGTHTITYTIPGICMESAMTNVVVNALPVVSVSGGPFCIDDAASNLTGSPAGGTFSGTGITDGSAGTFDPATAGVGTHTITYAYTDANGCSNSAMTNVVVNALPVVSVSGGPFCVDDAASNLTGSPAGGTFSGTGITDGSAGTFDPATAGVGTHTITYNYTDGNGCSNSAMTDVVVNALPVVSVSGGPFCIDAAASNLTGSPAGGTFSGTGITDGSAGTFDPATAGVGTHTITYNYTDANGCSNSAMTDVVVNALPVVSVSGGPYCVDDAASNLTGSPAGGTFSGTGITDGSAGTFDPATAGVGTHTITYAYTDANGCSNSAMTNVVVNALPVVSVSGGPFCVDDAASNLTGSPAGGTFSGTGITDGSAGTFDPATAGVGTHTITYAYTDANGCSNTAMTNVVVNALPVVSVSGGPFCIDAAASNLPGSPAGGTFSGTGITDGSAGTFDPATAGVGTHTITYAYTDANGCSNTAMTNVVVNALPVVSVSGGPFCIDDAASNLTGSPAGGTFSGTGITDGSAGTFDPATAGVGTHTITYAYTDANGCSNSAMTDVVVNALPVVSVSGGPFCVDDAASNLTGSPAGGTFSGTGITDGSAGTFDPATAGVGTHTITYAYTDANGCSNSAMTDVIVNALPVVSVSGGPFCVDAAASNLPASPTGGIYSGTGITDGSAGTFDPATAGIGTHTITYAYTDANGCSNTAMTDVVVNALPVVSVSGGPYCVDAAASNLPGSPAGGTFSGTGITDGSAGTFDPATAGVGTHTITYDYTDANGCSNSAMTDVVVNALPIVSVSGGPFCVDDAASNLTGNPAGGTFSGTGITDGSAGTFDPATAGVGTHTITYAYTDANGCSNTAMTDVIVNALPVMSVSGGPFCVDAAASNLPASPTGGIYSGTGITDVSAGTFDPATAGVGTHTITYAYTDANGCSNSAMTNVVVNALPVVSVSGGPFCVDAAASNLTGSPAGGTFSGTGITDGSAGTFDPATAGVGTHTITYDYTDANGCSNTAMTNVVVNALPVVSVSGGPFCVDDAAGNLTGSPAGGTFSGTGITDGSAGTFDPATAGVGTHTITYAYTDANGCSNTAMTDVVVNALPVVSVSGGPFCVDDAASNLTGSPAGGTFSGTGITDGSAGTFDPATAGVGTHTITYAYTDANGCSNSAMTNVVVNALPVVSVSGGPFCVDAAASNLTGSPAGGTFSGTGITDGSAGTFDPATAGVGTHTITYAYTDANGCSNSAMTDVVVNALPVVSVTGGTFCEDNPALNLTGSPAGGTFSGTGITDGSAGTFDPATAGVGTHTITYDYTDGNGCSNSAMTDVIVNPLPSLTLSGGVFCVDDAGSNLIGNPIGGSFSGPGITDSSAGTFDPATAGVGIHTITYVYEDINGCSNSTTSDVIVNALPIVSVSGGPFCVDDMATDLPASPTGGIYSGTGITDASLGTFDPATAGVGTHTITYDYTDGNGCSNSATTDVVVNALPIVNVSGGPFCVDDIATDLTASPIGGTFSGVGITDASAGTFDPATAGVGTHTITYNYTDANGCSNSAMTDVVVNALPVVNVSGGPFCVDDMATDLTASPIGGTFSGVGITDASAGTFDPATAGVGTHTITYDYTDGNGCMNSATVDVVVNALPVVNISGGPFCVDDIATDLPASPTGGIYSGTGITDGSAGTFDPATAGVGTHTITYDYTDGNGCMNSSTVDVVVNALPVVSISGGPFCVDDIATDLPASPTGGIYSGTGITDGSAGTFDPATAGVGTHTITYDYTDGNGCMNSATVDVVVNPLPTPSIVPVGPTCIGNGIITIVATPSGGTFSGVGIVDGIAGTFDPKISGLGTHTITYDYFDINGCFASTTTDIEVINCFDLALDKKIDPMGPQGPFVIGDEVTFIVTVHNQGQTDAINVVVEDYLPSSMSFVSSPDFELVMGSYIDTISYLAAGVSQELSITLQIDNYSNGDVINNAEIIAADDDNDPMNPDPEDQDSDLDSIIGSSDDNSETDTDDDIDDEDPGQPGSMDNPLDEDDYDPASLPILDLANTKTVDPASLIAAGGTFEPNENITFEVRVINQGNVVADNIVVTDTIPCGLEYNNSINSLTGWVLSGSGGSATFTVGSLAPTEDTTILITFNVKNSADLIADCDINPSVVPGEPFTNFSFITSAEVDGVLQTEDVDSEFDSFTLEEANTNPNENGDNDTNSTGNNQLGSQDDNDPALVEIFDLALSKIVSPLDLPYQVGETVTFEICVSSQGNVPSDSINIIDYIPAGLEYNTASDALGWTGTPGMSTATYSFDDSDMTGGTLDFGEQICVDIVLTILSNQVDFVNRSEITSANSIVDDGMGGTLTSLVTNDNDSTFDTNPADEAGGAEDTNSDALTNDIDDPAVLGNGMGAPGDEIAATDDDSADPALVPIVDFALRKRLADGTSTPVAVGDTIRFLIEILNQGNVGGSNITINDYIPNNLAFVDITANDNWMGATFGQSGVTAMTTLAGPLEPGEIDSIYIELEILAGGLDNEDYTNSAEIFTVFAAPSAPTGITPGTNITTFDVDSTPDANPNNDNGSDASSADNPDMPNAADDYVDGNGLDVTGMPDDGVQASDEDDADPALIAFHDVALTKTKSISQGPVDIGDVVTFTITVFNQGSSPLDSVSIIDYVPAGFTFTPNNNWVASGMNATLTATVGNTLLPSGGIVPGDSLEFPIELTVSPTATLDNLLNVAEITGSKDLNDLTQDDDFDSTADTMIDNDPGGSDDTPSDDQVNGDGTGVPGDEVAATDEDDSDPEGVELALYSLGNQVWLDNDNSGTINGSETGIENVTVELYNAGGMLVGTTMTDDMGLYLFDSLVSGEYTVIIPSLNFGMGAPLENLLSSSGGGQSDLLNGPSEDDITALDPDTDVDDNDDNGVLDGNVSYPGAVASNPITLGGVVDEPTGENPDNDPLTPDENENLTVDFGFVPLVSIGSNVFIDNNNDGIDDGDGGIMGVTVEVYDAGPDMMIGGGDDIFVGFDITDSNGDWLIDSLLPGDYYAVIPTPDSDYPNSSTPTDIMDNGEDGDDNGTQVTTGGAVTSPVINLAPNEEIFVESNSGAGQDDADDDNGDMTVDFGFPPLMSIGSTVFYDQNDDGVQDLTDPLEGGIEGVQVDLYYDANNDGMITGAELTPIDMTTTDADGNYFFGDLLPGNYQVGVPTPDASAQTSSTGQNTTDNEDLSDDGDQPLVGGLTLSPIVNLEGGQEPTEDPANPGADQDDGDELNGNMTVDFGFIPQMSIGSTVFYDPNDNGIQDTSNPLEDGIEGVTVNLYLDADGDGSLTGSELTPVMTTVTDAEGDYFFGMLPEGDYIVGVNPTGGAPVSSTGQMTGDGVDGNDNGDQPGGSGTEILSNPVNLDGNMETHTEDEQGGDQDDGDENNGDMTVDFGLVPNMSIGSTVFYDQNDDGVQDLADPLEGGIEGVQVDLYYDADNDGSLTGAELTPVASTTTDADGNYYFGNLPEGNYQVGVPTPDESAQTSSTGQNTTDNEDLSDDGDQPVSGGPTLSPIVNLEAGMEPDEDPANPGADQDDGDELNGNMTVDFGFIPQMSIGSTVFYDPNDNGIQDTSNPLEDGVEGVTVNLYLDADGDGSLTGSELTPVMTTVTDAEGDYFFGMLPEGDYIVGVDPTGGAPVSSTGQMTADGVDGNDNGEQPGGSGAEILSNPVNLDGNMETHTEDEQGGDQDDGDENNGDMTVDFGLVPNMSIGSTVFYDQNDDGVQDLTDPLEGGIEGVQVDLYYDADNDGSLTGAELTPVASTTTDADGNYYFGNLPEGNYQVGVPTPDESAQTSSTGQNTTDNEDLSDDGDQPVSGGPTLSPIVNLEAGMEPDEDPANPGADQDDGDELNGNMTVDFGFIPQMSIGSTVFYDPNDNGIQDTSNPLEDGIEGVTVNLYLDADGDGSLTGSELIPVMTTVTDAEGDYFFSMLPEGDYIVGVDPTGGAPVSSTGQMTADGVDGNDNGEQPGGSGTEILSNPVNLDGNMETHTEDEQGGDQDDGDENNGDMTVDFGLVPNMSIGSTVFYDQNDDGVQDLTDPLEGGIEGVQVDLYYDENNDGSLTGAELTPVASTTTDADGNYYFGNLPEGNYQVGVPTPDESAQTSSTGQNTTDNEDLSDDGDQSVSGGPTLSPIVNLEAGMEPDEDPANPGADQDDGDELNGNMTVDFGFIPQMSIGSTVFYDPNDNGIQDTSNPLEDGIEGVTVNLYLDADGDGSLTGTELTPVMTTVTDAEGDYFFDMLPEGDYIVGVNPTGGAPVSSTGQMTGDGVDGNDNGDQPGGSGTEILSNPVNLDGNMETHTEDEQGGNQDDGDENNGDMTVDFGLVPNMSIGSTVFYDQNDDGVQDLTDPLEGGIEGVQVDLYYDENNDGSLTGAELTPVASTTTDADGNYYFGNLPEGNYQVGVPTPDESAQTSSTGQNTTDNEDLSDDGDQPVSGGPTLSPIVNLEAGMEPDEDPANPGADQDDGDELNGNMTVDFGFIPQMSIGSTVFYDPNDNGIQDTSNPLEDGIEGVTVNLYLDADGDGSLTGSELTQVMTTVTDAEGDYFFGMLPEGDYIVGVNPTGGAPVSSAGQMTADGVDGNDNGEQPGGSGTEILSNPVNLDGNMETHTEDEQGGDQDDGDENNGDMTVDFGLVPNMSIGSTVFLDNNDDGMQDPLDPTEVGIEGVTVQLLYDENNDGIIDGDELIPVSTIWTDSNGDYFFGNLPEGNYQVVIPTAPDSAPTSSNPTDGMDNGEDGDDNGAQPGGAGTAVSSPIINLTATEEPQDVDETGQGGMQDNTTASPDDNGDMTIDFGFIPYVSVGSNVFVDENNDGIDQGADEEGIEGITVEVYSTGPDMMIGGGDDILVGMDVTDVNGDWLVDSLTPGEYYAVIDMVDPIYPTSSTTDFDADDEVDNNDNGVQAGGSGTSVVSNEFTLTGDAETTTEPGPGGDQDDSDDDNGDMTVDFGFVPYYSLGNQVWIDDNYDGLINGSEIGIDGVDVELYDTAGNLIGMTVTMDGGMYLFDSLLPGDYIVVIPAAELAPGGTLQDYLSSSGTFNMGGPYENPGVDAETDIDNDDNGTFDTNGNYPASVVSSVVTLGGDDEPLNENPDNDPNTLDQYENLTVDFGFIEKIYDVALIKETDMETGNKVGDILTFTITVSNQGNTPLTNIEVTDYIASGFIDVPAQNSLVMDAGGSGWSAELDNKITYVIGDTLAPNESTEITVYLELGQSLEPGGYVNYGEVSMFQDTIGNSTDGTGPYVGGIDDEDSTPDDTNDDPGGQPNSEADDYVDGDGTGVIGDGVATTDEDDHDPALIQVVDIALAKTVATAGPYIYGQEVEFNIEVTNQGNVDLEDILVSDYIPCGMTFGPSNSTWSVSSGVATTTIEALAAGTSTNLSIYFTVIPVSGSCGYDEAYVNYAEVSIMFADYDGDGIFDDDVSTEDVDSEADADEDNDAGGEPQTDSDDYVEGDGTGGVNDGTDSTDEDDHDPAFINIFDLAQIKFIDDIGPYDIGETVTFEFEITNQGNVDAFNIEVTDYLMDGFGFTTIGNDGWSENGSNLVYTIDGPLAPGETETLFLELTVALPDNASVQSWYNESEISAADDDMDPMNEDPTDADSTPDDNPDNDNDLVDGPDDDPIFDPDDDNDNVIDENPNDPFGIGDDDEDDNDAAGILVVGGLGDTVWKDVNGDGIQDPGEAGVEGVEVILTDCMGNVVATQTTDANGFYFFNNLIPGDYQVQFDISNLPLGCAFTQQDQGGDDELDSDVDDMGFAPCTNIQGGEYDSTFDAGLFILPDIGDFVWHDTDGDGIQDPNEPGIEEVMVLLYNEDNELIQVTMTDQDGYYLFPDVYPDTYYIVFVDPDGFESTFPNTTDDENDSDITNFVFTTEGSTTDLFDVVFGQVDDLSFDAGYYKCIPIGELVWYDVDEDDIWDSTENGINGLEVKLYRLEGGSYVLWEETVTGHKPGTPSDDGYFKFCAPPGTYYVEMIMPPIGLVQANANVINNLPIKHPNEPTTDSDLTNNFGQSTTASFNVLSGEMVCNIGAGFYPMATAGNRVWEDYNENGLQDSGEGNVANVTVEAYEVESGLKVAESVTNDLGIYTIEYLQKKDYYLKFIPPSGYGFTSPNTGDEDKDSDVDHSFGFQTTAAYSLEPGETYLNIDAGLRFGVLPVVWLSINAEHKGDHNIITWSTASEVNTDRFELERSLNGLNKFEYIGEVEAAGESVVISSYEIKDEDVRPGIYYYRVKQIDRDGEFDYSDVVNVTIKSDKNLINLAPNPAHGISILSIDLESNKEASVKIIGSDGRLIRSYDLESESGYGISTTIEINDLPTGVYSVSVTQGTFTKVKKLIIIE